MKFAKLGAVGVFLAAGSAAMAQDALIKEQPNLTLTAAQLLIDTAREEAAEQNLTVTMAVVNPHGDLIAFERMDGAPLVTIDAAIGKSKASVSFGVSSQTLADWAYGEDQKGGPVPFLGASGQWFALDGGHPIYVDGALVGAIGVNGAPTTAADDEIAEQAIEALLEAAEE